MMRTDASTSGGEVAGRERGPAEPQSAPPASLFVRRRAGASSDQAVIRRPSISYWQDARMRLAKNKIAMLSAAYIVVLALLAGIVPEVIDYSYDEQEIWNKHALPNLGEEAIVLPEAGLAYAPVTVSAEPARETVVDSTVSLAEAPPAPAGLRVVGDPLTVGVVIQWDPVPGAEGYRVYRSIVEGSLGVPIDDVPAEHVSYRDTSSLASGGAVHYYVAAFNAFGDSPQAAHVGATPQLALPLGIALRIDPAATAGGHVLTKPHYLGTDYLGRDLLARVMVGARISLFIGFVVPLLYVLIGIIYGSVSGYFGGLVDEVMMRIADVVATVPELLVVILLQVVLGNGLGTLIIALVAGSWSRSARQIRGESLRLREMEFVHAAKVLGTPFRKIIGRHLLPNVMGTVLVLLTVGVPYAIFSEAFLSFIGLGIEPPMASWGVVAKEGARVFLTYPHELLIPSALICVTMLAFNLLGDGLRDALDPKLRGAK